MRRGSILPVFLNVGIRKAPRENPRGGGLFGWAVGAYFSRHHFPSPVLWLYHTFLPRLYRLNGGLSFSSDGGNTVTKISTPIT